MMNGRMFDDGITGKDLEGKGHRAICIYLEGMKETADNFRRESRLPETIF
jgi:hypothetical protein